MEDPAPSTWNRNPLAPIKSFGAGKKMVEWSPAEPKDKAGDPVEGDTDELELPVVGKLDESGTVVDVVKHSCVSGHEDMET